MLSSFIIKTTTNNNIYVSANPNRYFKKSTNSFFDNLFKKMNKNNNNNDNKSRKIVTKSSSNNRFDSIIPFIQSIEPIAESIITIIGTCFMIDFLFKQIGLVIENTFKNVKSTMDRDNRGHSNISEYLKPNVTLNSYELEVAESVIKPSVVVINMSDIVGMPEVKESLLDLYIPTTMAESISPTFKSLRSILFYGSCRY